VLQLIACFDWVNRFAPRTADGRVTSARCLRRSALFARRFLAPWSPSAYPRFELCFALSMCLALYLLAASPATCCNQCCRGRHARHGPLRLTASRCPDAIRGGTSEESVFPYGCNEFGIGQITAS